MTCVVGIIKEKSVIMGADSRSTDENFSMLHRADNKIFLSKCKNYVIGFSGQYREGQILRYCKFPSPKRIKNENLLEFMITKIVPFIIKSIKRPIDTDDNDKGEFLIGVKGRIFHIDFTFQVIESNEKYLACGIGSDIALGALYILEKLCKKMSPEEMVSHALEASSKYNASVGQPFIIEKLQ